MGIRTLTVSDGLEHSLCALKMVSCQLKIVFCEYGYSDKSEGIFLVRFWEGVRAHRAHSQHVYNTVGKEGMYF